LKLTTNIPEFTTTSVVIDAFLKKLPTQVPRYFEQIKFNEFDPNNFWLQEYSSGVIPIPMPRFSH
jgi:hypothetical protein